MEHDLKCWPEPFAATWDGRKLHEVRVDDRGFSSGDTLVLRCWNPASVGPRSSPDAGYTGAWVKAEVTYVTPGGEFGLPDRICVMSIRVLARGSAGRRGP